MTNTNWGEHEPEDKPGPYKKVYWYWDPDEVASGSALYLIHTLEDTFVLQRGMASPVSENLRIGPVFTDLQAAKMFYLLTN